MRTMVLLASALLVGGTAEGQATAGGGRSRTIEREARTAAEAATAVRDRVLERFAVDDSAMMNRATIGVSLGGSAHKRDTLGVFVEAVAEDGPAERAGVYEGHRIAFINNVDVRASAADAGDPYLSSVGRHRLMRAMRDVKAGNTVTLRVWTGSGYRDVQLTAARFADVYKHQRFGGMFHPGTPSAFGWAPAMEALRMTGPDIRHMELHPSEVRRIEVRPAPASRIRTTVTPSTPRAPLELTPSTTVTPRVITVPRLVPTQSRVRRYTI